MSLRSRGSFSLSVVVLFVGAIEACGPTGTRRVRPETDADVGGGGGDQPEGGSGGTAGAGSGGRGGQDSEGGSGGSTGGTGGSGGTGGELEPDAGEPIPDAAPPADAPPSLPRDAAPLPPDARVLPPDMMAPPPDVAPPSTLNNGLVSRWKMDEGTGNSTQDATSTGNAGTLTSTTWVKPGYPRAQYTNPAALHFDGANAVMKIDVKGMPALDQANSMALWVNYASVPAGTQPFVGLGASAGRLKLGINGGQLAAWKMQSSTPVVTATAPGAGWHHIAYTFDGTTRRLYVDGASKATSTTAGDSGAVIEGNVGAYGTQPFEGDIDEVRIYKRALTASEVSDLASGKE
jgi:hypothetical protein